MCDLKRWELYDTNEYFLQFLEISPQLYYVDENTNILEYNKHKLQVKLLTSLKNNIISKDLLKKIYIDYVEYENKKNNKIISYENNFKIIIENMKKENKEDKIFKINSIISSIENNTNISSNEYKTD